MPPKTVTSVDVAHRAGVSQSTVSRVFSAEDRVSGETRARVLAAAQELGYQP
ncbi:MAG: LacI family DNA-binding transcriptional regulator, partial [Anaerolineales bacterium]|nr:LacI family DNA-binding transcriptional regulator [Anaerolineales bacterium]